MAQRPDPASHNATLKLYLCGPGQGGERESERARAPPPLTESAAGVRTGVSVSRRGQGYQAVPAGHQGSPPPFPPQPQPAYVTAPPSATHRVPGRRPRAGIFVAYAPKRPNTQSPHCACMCVREPEINNCRTEPGRAGVARASRPSSAALGLSGSRPPPSRARGGVGHRSGPRQSPAGWPVFSTTTLRDRFPAIRPDASTQRVAVSQV